jgi:hypothetical protein
MSTIATSMPSSDVPLELPLQIFQKPQRFDRPHLIDLQAANLLLDLVGSRLEKPDLHRRSLRARSELFHGMMLRLLVQRQHLPRPLNHAHGQPRESGHFDPVAAVRFARLYFAQKDNAVAGLFHGYA